MLLAGLSVDESTKHIIEVSNNATSKMLEKASANEIDAFQAYHNVGRRYIGMARMPASRKTFSKPPNSQTKEL